MPCHHALAALLALVLLLPLGGASAEPSPSVPGQRLALVGGTVHTSPTRPPVRDGVVLTQGGAIAAVGPRGTVRIPADAEIVDCSGLTVVAGFWNSHVHFLQRKWEDAAEIPAPELGEQLQAMLTRYGFTSVFDTGSRWENTRRLRDRIESGETPGPRIYSTGEIIYPERGSPSAESLAAAGAMPLEMPEVADDRQARAAARALLDAGTDGIKLYAATWAPPFVALPEPLIRAAAGEARRRGRPVFAHPSSRDGLLAAVRGGADVLVHTAPQAGPWDDEILTAMLDAGVALVPTLKLWRHELRHERHSARERFTRAGVDQLRAWAAAGGEVLFGTDVGYMADYDPADEYALMAEAGMDASAILASLTTAPAERLAGETRSGRLAPGAAADIVILADDPWTDVRAFAAVRFTIRRGAVIYGAAP